MAVKGMIFKSVAYDSDYPLLRGLGTENRKLHAILAKNVVKAVKGLCGNAKGLCPVSHGAHRLNACEDEKDWPAGYGRWLRLGL
ncbi:hypothetical protein Tco_0700617 [Tanacetum coccineum]